MGNHISLDLKTTNHEVQQIDKNEPFKVHDVIGMEFINALMKA